MSTTKYYLGFASSPALEEAADVLLEKHEQGTKESLVPAMDAMLELFIPELLHAFLVGTVDAVGLSGMSHKVVHSSSDIIGKTIKMLIPHLLKKRTNDEMGPLVAFVDDSYLRKEHSSNDNASTGCEIDKATYDRFNGVVNDIKAGKGESVREELADMMIMTVDILLEGMLKKSVSLLKHGFVVRKLIDGAIATIQAAGHGVVNKVFRKLDNDQMVKLADYFETLLLTAER